MASKRETVMIDSDIEDIIRRAQQRLQQRIKLLKRWKSSLRSLPDLGDHWVDKQLVLKLPLPRVSAHSHIAAVDGGLLVEELRGLDVFMARAIAVTFTGVGKRVKVDYFPNFDPEPRIVIRESFESRSDLSQFSALFRLSMEYSVSLHRLQKDAPEVLFIDGSVTPLLSDLTVVSEDKELKAMLSSVKDIYRKLVRTAEKTGTVLMGIVKDSRSRDLTRNLQRSAKQWSKGGYLSPGLAEDLLDTELSNGILDEGTRTAWFKTNPPSSLQLDNQIHVCYARPIASDDPVRLEVLVTQGNLDTAVDKALQALYILCQHGLPIALPTNLQEADRQVKLKREMMDTVVEQLSLHFGIPVERMRKRRTFDSSFLHFT